MHNWFCKIYYGNLLALLTLQNLLYVIIDEGARIWMSFADLVQKKNAASRFLRSCVWVKRATGVGEQGEHGTMGSPGQTAGGEAICGAQSRGGGQKPEHCRALPQFAVWDFWRNFAREPNFPWEIAI
jgi:hypothetical protein